MSESVPIKSPNPLRAAASVPDTASPRVQFQRRARRRVHQILEAGRSAGKLGLIFEVLLIALITANVIAVTVESVPAIGSKYSTFFIDFEIVSMAIFTVEYFLRIWTAPEDPRFADKPFAGRLRFGLQPFMVIDLLAIAPTYLAIFVPMVDLRILRMFRLMRLLKMARYSPAVATLVHVLSLERRALFGTLLLLLCVMCMSAEAMYIIEGRIQPNTFGTLPDCMYWAIVTLTTVGYGDRVPITEIGKLLAGVTAIFGLGLFALPVGIIATGFMGEIHRRDFVVTWSMLSRIPLFTGFDVGIMSELMVMLRSQMVGENVPVVVAGESASAMYFIISGEAHVETPEKTLKLAPGAFFGEQALLHSRPYEATVVAHTALRLLALPAQDFAVLLRKYPGIRKRIERAASRRDSKSRAKRQAGVPLSQEA